jgi:hypothetical protein
MARESSATRSPPAPARHARAADEVGVREWAQLLVERGRQLRARAERDPRHEAPSSTDRAAPQAEPVGRRRRR